MDIRNVDVIDGNIWKKINWIFVCIFLFFVDVKLMFYKNNVIFRCCNVEIENDENLIKFLFF